MRSIAAKEFAQFFSSLTGYIAIAVFLLVNGLVLFVFQNNVLDGGYASLERFFTLAPWVLTFLIPAVCMRTLSDEYRSGTFEILRTLPLTPWRIVAGKFLGCLGVSVVAILPTVVYFFTVNALAIAEGIDSGAAVGSWLGLLFLAAAFTAIAVAASSITPNAVVAFLLGVGACLLLYYGFSALAALPAWSSTAAYVISLFGIDAHYRSISRGVVDSRDLVYFVSVVVLFLFIAQQNTARR